MMHGNTWNANHPSASHSFFPEDRCKFHVLAWNISEKQHEDITSLRENIFELVPYLHGQGIVHALATPSTR